jgi:hypothetical protein
MREATLDVQEEENALEEVLEKEKRVHDELTALRLELIQTKTLRDQMQASTAAATLSQARMHEHENADMGIVSSSTEALTRGTILKPQP